MPETLQLGDGRHINQMSTHHEAVLAERERVAALLLAATADEPEKLRLLAEIKRLRYLLAYNGIHPDTVIERANGAPNVENAVNSGDKGLPNHKPRA